MKHLLSQSILFSLLVLTGNLNAFSATGQGDGTLENPYNAVAAMQKACELAVGETSTEKYFIKGKISQIQYTFNAQYGTAVFWISDDGTTDNQFYIYATYYLEGLPWREGNAQIVVGDDVIIYGKLANYKGTLETADRQNYIYSLNGMTKVYDDGDSFTAKTEEGVEMTFQVISLAERTCKVGTDYYTYTSAIPSTTEGNVTIPQTVNGFNVTRIGDYAFYCCENLKSIVLPNSVTSIGQYAFYDCTGLTSVTIPESVTTIGYAAFFQCSGLTSIVVEAGNSKYDSRDNCNAIIETSSNTLIVGCTNTVIPNNVTSIGMAAFSKRTGLTSVTIPNSVTSIGGAAFAECTGLTSVTIPESVTSIGNSAFSGCTGLTSVTILGNVTSISGGTFWECSNLTSVIIPNSVTTIGNEAFCGCSNLTSIIIPNSVTTIGNAAFARSGLTSVSIPNSVTTIGEQAFEDCTGLTSVSIPNSVTTIGFYAFYGCTGLTSVSIPKSVTSISKSAFAACTSLTSIVVEAGNSKYDSRDNCNAIIETSSNTLIVGCMNTVIPDNVTTIGKEAFYKCSNLTNVTIPNSVTTIGEEAFYKCSNLISVIIPNSVTTIGEDAFRNCIGLTSVISYIQEPFVIDEDVFSFYDDMTNSDYFTSATLYVPKGTKEKYEATSAWNKFQAIVEMEGDETGIETMTHHDNVGVKDSYDLRGHRLDAPQKGLNIIRMSDGTTKKVVIK